MKILAIDTSGPVCGAAVLQDQVITAEATLQNRLTHSSTLMELIDRVLTGSDTTLQELDRIAVVTGPGSFTGVRIGVSTAKALAHGSGRPCVAVDALFAMAAGTGSFDGLICPIQDARGGQVYGAAFDCHGDQPQRVMDDAPMKLEDYTDKLLSLGSRFLFVGDGMPVHRARLAELLGDKAVFAPPHLCYLRPASVAVLAEKSEQLLAYQELMPLYLRQPSAEKNKRLMEAQKHA